MSEDRSGERREQDAEAAKQAVWYLANVNDDTLGETSYIHAMRALARSVLALAARMDAVEAWVKDMASLRWAREAEDRLHALESTVSAITSGMEDASLRAFHAPDEEGAVMGAVPRTDPGERTAWAKVEQAVSAYGSACANHQHDKGKPGGSRDRRPDRWRRFVDALERFGEVCAATPRTSLVQKPGTGHPEERLPSYAPPASPEKETRERIVLSELDWRVLRDAAERAYVGETSTEWLGHALARAVLQLAERGLSAEPRNATASPAGRESRKERPVDDSPTDEKRSPYLQAATLGQPTQPPAASQPDQEEREWLAQWCAEQAAGHSKSAGYQHCTNVGYHLTAAANMKDIAAALRGASQTQEPVR